MKFLMLCREPRLYSCQRLKEATEKLGHHLDILDPNRFLLRVEQSGLHCYYQQGEIYDKNRPIPQKLAAYDGVIPRFGTSSTEMGCSVLQHFELQGIPVLNRANSFRLARDKWQSLQLLSAACIAVPSTQIAGELIETKSSLNTFSFPIIIKTLQGSQGVGVMLSESQASAVSLLDTFKITQIKTLSQQFIPEGKGQDIRAFVIGNQVVATMQRQGSMGEFRANIHQGGNAVPCQLSHEEQQLAIRATQALGLEIAGVDLICTSTGLLVLEVNASPGLEMIENVSQQPIAEKIIEYFIAKISH